MAKAKEVSKKEKVDVDLTGIKDELKEYVDLQIKKGFNEELEKANKRLIREKNKKIIFKNITIIILLALVCFLLFLLYKANYFNKYFTNDNVVSENVVEKTEKEKVEEKEEVTLQTLINQYSYLLDNIYIDENSIYISDYYNGKLTNEIKSYIALNNLGSEHIDNVEDYNMFSEDNFKETYLKIFNDFKNVSFDYNGNKIRYLSMMNSYISNTLITNNGTNIKREIVDIKVGDNIVITTVEGLVIDNKLYNITDNAEILDYNNEDLNKYKNVLNKVVYTFKDGKLINIGK